MLKNLLFIFSLLNIFPSILLSNQTCIKYVRSDSQAAKCMYAIDYYLKNSAFLSKDLKKALSKHPEKIHDFGMALLAVIYYASQRPQALISQQAETRLLTGIATCEDLIAAYQEILCYGEHYNDHINELEPTTKEKSWQDTIIPEPIFCSAVGDVYKIIEQVGYSMKWSTEKITEEKKLLKEKIVTLVSHYLSPEYATKLHEEVTLLKDEKKQLNDKIHSLLRDYQKTQRELVKSEEDVKKLCDGMLPRNKMLREASIIGAMVFCFSLALFIGCKMP